jgi:predicted O-methyltransferase YrrM
MVREIFKNSRSSNSYAKLLYRLTNFYKPNRILELGTSLGWGTLHLHCGNAHATINTVEGCPKTFMKAKELFPLSVDAVNFHNAQFDDYISNLNSKDIFDLIFIDGHHNGEALLNYVELLLPHAHENTIWLLDDIRWSDDMWNAWRKIIQDDRFHVSIDLLRMGMIVLRGTQKKEHFVLKVGYS